MTNNLSFVEDHKERGEWYDEDDAESLNDYLREEFDNNRPSPDIPLWITLGAILWIVVFVAANYIFKLNLLP